ncbi:hypothetical protein HDU98_002949, partial [Podochytrium sp. JEL0797]
MPSNVLLLLDTTCDIPTALHHAATSLACSPTSKITIIHIVPPHSPPKQTASRISHALTSLHPPLHPCTRFSISVLPESTCLLENA